MLFGAEHKKTSQPAVALRGLAWFFKWYPQESNQGHKDFQSFALPTELGYLSAVQI